ncbi:MAG TPA: NAD(P)/FAD-dependent oxidoreductase [Ignavibacteria bacterium]|nr:NAD(P)/FAD-dependent oxidoreductase [Ignavibacteria bacterium]
MTSRREFLKQSSLIAAGTLIAPKVFSLNLSSKPAVVILGAGFSGLAAGMKLKENGFDVTILEARKRIGGRVFSHNIPDGSNDDLVIELGAEWIGGSHERIKGLCNEFSLEMEDNRFKDRLIYKGKFYDPESWDWSPDWKVQFEKILADYKNLTEQEKIVLDKMDWWRFLMNHDIPEKDLDIREYADSTDFGESIRFVSAYSALAEYAESNEYNEMDFKVKGGNKRIAEGMAEKIGMENILLEHKATEIDSSGKVKIKCSNGKVFTCDKLICTVPTFAMSKIIFTPVLSPEKIEAINALQYSRIIKSATIFKERFWKDESFSILTDTYTHYFYHATKNQKSPKGVLITYAVGDKADILSKMVKEERIKVIIETLKTAMGDVSGYVEDNLNYYWGDDEYSKGAYALYGKGQWFGIMPALRENTENIYFAGEHVADWQGFMEGALNSGEDAAEKIMS